MASITSTGVGSGLDVESIVTQLMAVERQPITDIQTKEASYTSQLSAIGQVTSSLSSLQTAAQALETNAKMNAMTGSIADSTIGAVTVSTGAVTGSYQLEVSKLATTQKLVTQSLGQPMSSLATGSATGSITFDFGTTASDGTFTADSSRSKTISLTAQQMTPANLRDAINQAKVGATATLLTDSTGSRLVITSTATGATQSMKISVNDPDGNNTDGSGLSALAYDPSAAAGAGRNQTQTVAASDAAFSLDGIPLTSSTNSVDSIITGVSLTLAKTNVGNPTTVTIGSDDSKITGSIDSFITAYNNSNTLMRSLTAYDATSKTGGVLQGDSSINSVESRLRQMLTSAFGTSSSTRLSDIGITIQKDGSLSRDTTKFNTAFTNDRDSVVSLFTGNDDKTKSLGYQLDNLMTQFTGSDGLLTARTAGINSTLNRLGSQVDDLNTRMVTIEARYRAQYTALDTELSTLQAQSTQLTQQLASIKSSTS